MTVSHRKREREREGVAFFVLKKNAPDIPPPHSSYDSTIGTGAEEDEDEDADEDGATPCQIAQACIDKLGTSLPMKYVWAPGFAAAMQCLGTGESKWRKAGCSCLGNLAEGCQDPLRLVLDQCLPLVSAPAPGKGACRW